MGVVYKGRRRDREGREGMILRLWIVGGDGGSEDRTIWTTVNGVIKIGSGPSSSYIYSLVVSDWAHRLAEGHNIGSASFSVEGGSYILSLHPITREYGITRALTFKVWRFEYVDDFYRGIE